MKSSQLALIRDTSSTLEVDGAIHVCSRPSEENLIRGHQRSTDGIEARIGFQNLPRLSSAVIKT